MSHRKKIILFIILPILLLCTVCAAPWAYWAYRDNKVYQTDVDRLYDVAEKLGYSEENYIRFYHFQTTGIDWSADLITLVFQSVDPFEQFAEKVDRLQFIQLFGPNSSYTTRAGFLEFVVDYDFPDKLLTLNNSYLHNDFYPTNRLPPEVTKWMLKDPDGSQRGFEIYFAQKLNENDVWLLEDQQISGNIIVVRINRLSGVR